MKVAIVGGKLQGTEASYLARKANWEILLIDRKPVIPAMGLCDTFHQLDVTKDIEAFPRVIRTADLIIPALEDTPALQYIAEIANKEGIPFAYDSQAYAISSSKRKSDTLFAQLGIPAPQPWPNCNLPVIIKPSESSGSRGVHRIDKREELLTLLDQLGNQLDNWVIQEFLEGPSYSLEVIGAKERFISLQCTEIIVDDQYDCKRVLAPAELTPELDSQFRDIAQKLARSLDLNGIMDIEVIVHNNSLKVLEIDARLPSQTPTVVYKSTGINMLELLYDVFVKQAIPQVPQITSERGVVYQHIKVSPGELKVCGEHIMSNSRPLRIHENFFGADEALTDFDPRSSHWVATLIVTEGDQGRAWNKSRQVIQTIQNYFGLSTYVDPIPDV